MRLDNSCPHNRTMSNKAPKTKVTRSSACNCGQVELSVTGIDKGAAVCHCDNCQRSTGTVFAHNHRFTEAELQIQKGGDKIKEFPDNRTKSGATLYRHFCTECVRRSVPYFFPKPEKRIRRLSRLYMLIYSKGSNLYLNTSAVEGLILLNAGSLLGERVQPTVEMFPENKYPWIGNVKAERAKL